MIAKKNILIISELHNSSLQISLQSRQLSPLTSFQVQAVSFAVYKEQSIVNQNFHSNFFANLFAKPFCRIQKIGEGRVYEQTHKKKK